MDANKQSFQEEVHRLKGAIKVSLAFCFVLHHISLSIGGACVCVYCWAPCRGCGSALNGVPDNYILER